MQIELGAIEQFFYLIILVLVVNFIIGLFQRFAPEVLPPILRKEVKEMKTYKMTVLYKGPTQSTMHHSEIQGDSLEQAERAVLDELNKKKFISLKAGEIIPTNAIIEVQIKEKPEPFDALKYHDEITNGKAPF